MQGCAGIRGAALALLGCWIFVGGAAAQGGAGRVGSPADTPLARGTVSSTDTMLARVPVSPADAPVTGGISGQIVAERTGEPLAGAVVEVREAMARVAADGTGRFRLDGLKPGRYTLEVSLLGRAQAQERVEVQTGQVTQVAIELGMAPVTLEALTVKLDRTAMVSGQMTRIPGSAHVVTPERMTSQRLVFDDVHALLRHVPGVNVSDEEGHGRRPNIGMRGTGVGRSAKVAIMEDGVLAAPAPYSAPAAYLFPVVGRMESIEVRKGSSQVKYGPWTTGGALNLVSSSIPAGLEGLVDVAGGQDGNAKLRARVGSTHGNFGWLAETYQLQTGGFKRLDTGGDTGFELQDYMLKLRLGSGTAARVYQDVELKLGRTAEASRETYLGLAEADFRATPLRRYAATELDRLDTEATQYSLRHFVRPATNVDLTTVAYRNEFARTWYKLDRMAGASLAAALTDPARSAQLAILRGDSSDDNTLFVRSNARDYISQGVQSVLGLQFDMLAAHSLEVGARYHFDSEDRFQHEDGYRMDGGRLVLTRAGAPGSQDNRVGEARALSLFVEDRITAGAWTFTPGVRYENVDYTSIVYEKGDATRGEVINEVKNGSTVLVPGIGITRLVGRSGQLFAGVHRGYGPPGPGADDRTEPESSVNYELGGRIEASGLSVQVAGFYNDYSNILGKATLASGESGTGELFNGGSVLVQGLEASAEYDAAQGRGWGVRVPVRAAYTYTDGKFRSAFQSTFGEWGNVEEGDELPYLPKHQASASAGLEAPRWRAELSAVNSAAMRTRAGSGALETDFSTDAFTVLNVAAEYGVTPWSRLFASVQNVTDASYVVARRPAGARPGLPRTFTLGVRATLR
jgi:Fe(3+) dicitrate transport protein